jgi:TonB family protein
MEDPSMTKAFWMTAATTALAALSMTNARAEGDAQAAPSCAPRLQSAATSFPNDLKGYVRSGTTTLDVTVGRDGNVTAAGVRKSSGSQHLDGAAVRSALSAWQFTAGECDDAAYPIRKSVVVEYVARPVYTFSAMRVSAYRRNLQNAIARGCAVFNMPNGDTVSSCIAPNAQDSRLADR